MTEFSFEQILKEMEHTPLPEDVVYVPSVETLGSPAGSTGCEPQRIRRPAGPDRLLQRDNSRLNALEYHRSSEIDIAATDLILLLGCQQDIEADDTYDTSKVEAFFVPAGTAVELYATTLHYAPCSVKANGFRCVIVLPKGTNEELPFKPAEEGENRLLTAVNKWLIAHEEAGIDGAFCGLRGENITV